VSATATAAATIVAGTERVVDRSTLTEVDGITVLVDEASTGVSTASMIQVVMAPDTRPTLARVDRREVWYVVKGVGYATGYYDRETQTVSPDWVEISAGDLLTVAPGGYRRIDAADTGLAVVIVSIPGGREDAARAGRLAGTDVTKKLDDQNVPGPTYVKTPRTHDRKKRSVEMYLDTAKRGTAKDAGAAVVTLRRGASVAEHTHTSETELLYVLDGHGTLVLDGVAYPITPTSAALIPAGATHTLTASDELRFFQLFTPGGPEKALTK
jgi:quercetin dioxygenase-like cupin family protein